MAMRTVVIVLLVVLLGAVWSSAFIVREWQQVIITRFGKPIGDAITDPGLHFRVPFIDKIHPFDKRFLEWDGLVTQVPTKEKKSILVDTYARWRITEPLLFFQRLKNEAGAHRRLDGILNGETRNAIASHNLVELVRTTNREPLQDESLFEGETSELESIEFGREKIRQEILQNAQERVPDLGIEILDVRFKRINYVEEVQRKVYDRMIAERKRISDRFRSEGEGSASRIRGEKDRELMRIRSEAYRTAQEIKGKADAEATAIYAGAYNQSADSRGFYAFLKTMETYRETFDEETWLVLSTQADYFRYLQESGR
ncbi:MAG: protease modulator HflC [bacterium]|nr:protease modulator HflC [bacterium]